MKTVKGKFGYRLGVIRNHLGITQHEFAEKVGVTQQYIGKLEIGKRSPSPGLVIAIAYKFRMPERWLFTGQGGVPYALKYPSL